jgi:4-amino-4-deoxy-L-arabinose transferase-like glycosyltransferase
MRQPLDHPPERPTPRESRPVAALARHLFPVLWVAAAVVLATGLFLPPLIAQDSSRFAVMAMRMHQENDWVHLVKDGRDYLDKPHLLFWSAMAGYRLFGVHEWSYRLVPVLVTVLGAWSTFRLGRRLHGAAAGRVAAVMFLTAYGVVLANHDVRMDTLLTGLAAFALWQLVRWLDTGDWRSMVLGAAGVGLAFSAKGLIAVAACGCALLFHVWSRGLWRRLWSGHLALGLAAFLATIAPVLLCYWLQFDLHPEKVVEGRTGVSGVKFILLGQSVERLAGGKGARHAGDPLFLHHSLLWVFLPWALLTYAAWVDRLRELARGRWSAFHAREQLTFLGPFVAIAILGLSRYKLAHYLLVFVPLLAIFTAAWLEEASRAGRWRLLGALRRVQTVLVVGLLVASLGILNGWAFPPRSAWVVAGALALGALLAAGWRLRDPLQRAWVPSALAMTLVNFVHNANYQPWLGDLQLGEPAAAALARAGVDWDRTFLAELKYPLEFYVRRDLPQLEVPELAAEVARRGELFLLAGEAKRAEVERAGLAPEVRLTLPDCGVLKMSPRVLDPRTRERECAPFYLLRLGTP